MTEESVQTSAPTEPADAIARLLTQIVEDVPNLQAVVVGYVRKDGAAAVRYTPMSTAMLSHLSRIFNLKIDREYMGSMFPQNSSPVRPPAIDRSKLSQAVRSHLAGLAAKKDEDKPSPAEKLVEREKQRNKGKAKRRAES